MINLYILSGFFVKYQHCLVFLVPWISLFLRVWNIFLESLAHFCLGAPTRLSVLLMEETVVIANHYYSACGIFINRYVMLRYSNIQAYLFCLSTHLKTYILPNDFYVSCQGKWWAWFSLFGMGLWAILGRRLHQMLSGLSSFHTCISASLVRTVSLTLRPLYMYLRPFHFIKPPLYQPVKPTSRVFRTTHDIAFYIYINTGRAREQPLPWGIMSRECHSGARCRGAG